MTKLHIGLPLRNDVQTIVEMALPVRRTSSLSSRDFLPVSRIAIYGVLFLSPLQFVVRLSGTACPRLFPLK